MCQRPTSGTPLCPSTYTHQADGGKLAEDLELSGRMQEKTTCGQDMENMEIAIVESNEVDDIYRDTECAEDIDHKHMRDEVYALTIDGPNII